MKLSMSLLAKYLHSYQPESYISNDQPSIKGIRFLSDMQSGRTADYLYLGNASGYFQDARYSDALLLACGNNQIFCHGSEYENLLNAVLSAFDYYGYLEQKLVLASGEHASLQEMLDIVGEILHSPILIFSIEGILLSSVHLDDLHDEMILESISSSNSLGSMAIGQTLVDREGKIHHDLTSYPQLLHPVDSFKAAVSLYLQDGDERLGFMMIFPDSENEEQISLCYAETFAHYLCKASEFHDTHSIHQADAQILSLLLSGPSPEQALVDKISKRINLDSQGSLILFQSLAIQNKTLHHLIMQELKEQPFESISCDYQNLVAILVTRKKEQEILFFLQRRLPSSNLSIGISLPIQDMNELYVAFNQAYFALSVTEEAGIRRCSELAMPYILKMLREDKMACQMKHPAIAQLQRYDRDNLTDLYNTLFSYIKHNCSQRDTADTLHIHLNTLKYRLKRIEELTMINFDDAEELLYLHLSFLF